jgi:hypothetical protein
MELGVAMAATGSMAQIHVEVLRPVGVRLAGILGSSTERS